MSSTVKQALQGIFSLRALYQIQATQPRDRGCFTVCEKISEVAGYRQEVHEESAI
jgi:hypothetical protein